MKRYLSSHYGNNIPIAIKCAKFQMKYGKPFTSVDIGVSGQKMGSLANKGILIKLEKKDTLLQYKIAPETIEYLKKRRPEEFKTIIKVY